MMVSTHRPVDSNNLGVEKRIGLDGREYRVRHNGSKKERQDEEDRQDIEDAERILADPDDKIIPFTQEDSTEIDYSNPSEGMHHAKSAIVSLRQIKPNDNLCVELVT